jgi:hypothetical protein
LKKEEKRKRKEKKIIELIIKENHYCNPGTGRKMRRTLPLGNFQKKRSKFKPCQQEEHRFWMRS